MKQALECQTLVSGTLGYVVERLRILREAAAEEELVVAERIDWMKMHEAIIEDGGSLDSD